VPAGLGAGGKVAVTFETTAGDYLPPSTVGTVWVPVLSESLRYTEDRYYSPQIRQKTMMSESVQSYYHTEGDIRMEVDSQWLPYFLYSSRHTVTKTGAGSPWQYKAVPSTSASNAGNPKSISITVIRNGEGFGYAGCTVGNWEYTIEDGVLIVTMGIVGVSEEEPGGLGTPAFTAPKILGADSHSIYVAAAAASPTFGAASLDFNGFTFTVNHNAEPQNRIRADRAASYISFGETEGEYTTELDFIDRTEYDNFVAATKRAIKLESIGDNVSFATSADAVKLQANNTDYQAYDVNLEGLADLIMAGVTGKMLNITGGDAYEMTVKSTSDITP